jgi:hypothetical protein
MICTGICAIGYAGPARPVALVCAVSVADETRGATHHIHVIAITMFDCG